MFLEKTFPKLSSFTIATWLQIHNYTGFAHANEKVNKRGSSKVSLSSYSYSSSASESAEVKDTRTIFTYSYGKLSNSPGSLGLMGLVNMSSSSRQMNTQMLCVARSRPVHPSLLKAKAVTIESSYRQPWLGRSTSWTGTVPSTYRTHIRTTPTGYISLSLGSRAAT